MSDKLLTCRVKKPSCNVRLFCFPWSGSGPSGFNPWNKLLSDDVELVGVMLPAREARYKEQCYNSAGDVATQVASGIHKSYSDKPFFFVGHSFGSLLCQEVAATLRDDYGLQPSQIYVSGESPPHSPTLVKKDRKDYKTMTDAELTNVLLSLGCLPLSVTDNMEILNVLLPAFRADLRMVDEIKYDLPQRLLSNPLTCPISYFEAVEDVTFDIQAWKQLTRGPFTVKKFVGSHLYMKDPNNQKIICDIINADAVALK